MSHITGVNGGVYTSNLVVEDCEDAWNEHSNGNVTPSADATYYKVGTKSAKFVTSSAGATELLGSETVTKDLSTYDALCWWARTSLASTSAGDLQIHLSESEECATPAEELNLPALTQDTWKQCFSIFAGTTASRNAIISVGLYQVTNLGDGDFYIDDVEALTEVDGIKSWTLSYNVAEHNTTDFASAGTSEFIPGVSEWSGSFEGYKDGAPLSIGTEVYLLLGESNTDGQGFVGKAIITNCESNSSPDAVNAMSYTFRGTGILSLATA